MSAKSKKRTKRVSAAELSQIERNLEKGNYKQAFKDAKVQYRQQASEQNRRLLERAHIGRARELYRHGLRDECRAVLTSLMELGVTDTSVQQSLPELLAAAGLFDRHTGKGAVPHVASDEHLLASVADHAVLRPEEAPASLPEVRQGAVAIRNALLALEKDDEAAVSELVRPIARNSPFADWKLFVRGLAAYYRQDAAEMQANWQRLDAERFPARIATVLRAVVDPAVLRSADVRVRSAVRRLETDLQGDSVLVHLQELQKHVAAERWDKAMLTLRRSREVLAKFDPRLLQRVSSELCSMFTRRGLTRPLEQLTRIAEPQSIDPHWNRARALAYEWSDDDAAEGYWKLYCQDLAHLPSLTPDERSLAQALVWLRVGTQHAELAAELRQRRSDSYGEFEEWTQAIACFGESLMLAPKLRSAYRALADAQQASRQPERAAETYRQLLEHFPEDIDALLHLVHHGLKRDEPLPCRELVARARRLKPLDKAINLLSWRVHVASGGRYAKQKQWDDARAELAAAERFDPSSARFYALLAHKALLELMAGNHGLGQQLIQEATKTVEPTVVFLVLTIESIRYGAPETVQKQFWHDWTTALKRKCRGETAGLMCELMASFVLAETDYPGREAHAEQLLAYVRRCSRVKWAVDDLRRVCAFLDAVYAEDEGELLEKYIFKGLREFPQAAYFPCMAGALEIRQGPISCDRESAREDLQHALELAKASNDPNDAPVIERSKKLLTFLDEAGPQQPPPFYFSDDEEDDEYDEDYDDDEEDEDESFDGNDMPAAMMHLFQAFCERMGLNPIEVLERVGRGESFDEIATGRKPQAGKTRKRKR